MGVLERHYVPIERYAVFGGILAVILFNSAKSIAIAMVTGCKNLKKR